MMTAGDTTAETRSDAPRNTAAEALRQRKRADAEALLAAAPLEAADGLADARAAARSRFLELGAPSRRDEYWKYTDPGALTAPRAVAEPQEPATAASADGIDGVDAVELVFVNGRFRPDLSMSAEDAGAACGLEIVPLGQAAAGGWAAEALGRLEAAAQRTAPRPLAALNGAALVDGLALRATGRATRPLRVRRLGGGEGASFERLVVKIESGAEATVIETGLGPARQNTVLEADIAEDGALHHVRAQAGRGADEVAAHLFARLATRAKLKSFTLSSGLDGELIRNESVVWLDGDEGAAHLAGGVVVGGSATLDNTLWLTHAAERCESRQVYKNVVGGRARGVFQGKILVREGAQKTDGYQISQSVLLDESAAFHAKPELEIYADDVVCSHGSTTGAIDADMLFYLRARGVPERIAQALLVQAFVEEAILEIADESLQEAMRRDAATLIARLAETGASGDAAAR